MTISNSHPLLTYPQVRTSEKHIYTFGSIIKFFAKYYNFEECRTKKKPDLPHLPFLPKGKEGFER